MFIVCAKLQGTWTVAIISGTSSRACNQIISSQADFVPEENHSRFQMLLVRFFRYSFLLPNRSTKEGRRYVFLMLFDSVGSTHQFLLLVTRASRSSKGSLDATN